MHLDYMIRCDMEGVSGVTSYDQVRPQTPEYAESRQWLMAELVALVEGFKEGGAERIVIYDEHYDGRNIDVARLPEGTEAIFGKPPYRADWAGGLDDSFAGMVLLGLHSKSGTPDGLLGHTYEHDIAEMTLNGVSVGEIGMEAAIAGDFGVRTVMMVGDSAGAAEARSLLPRIATVETKRSLGPRSAVCFSLDQITAKIRRTAGRVAAQPPPVEPYTLTPPVKLEIRFRPGVYLDTLRKLHAGGMDDGGTLALSGPSATQVWATYWQVKLRCQAEIRRS